MAKYRRTGPNTPPETWIAVRADYEAGRGSCRILAEKYGLNPVAVSSRCRREGWTGRTRRSMAKFSEILDKQVAKAAQQTARTLSERASHFVERTIDESEDWLNCIQKAKALLAAGDVSGLRDLVNAWKVPVAVGREALGLTAETSNRVNVAIFSEGAVIVETAPRGDSLPEPEPCPVIDLPPTETD